MKTPSAILLLLWAGLVLVRAEHTDLQEKSADTTSTLSDIHTVLREMTALVAKLEVELKYTKTQVDAVETRLRASENKADTMETRLRDSEKTVEQLQSENEALKLSLTELKEKQEEQGAALSAIGGSLERRVVFSVSLETSVSGNTFTGPFKTGKTLIHKHIFTNIGNAYNSITGFFTAPVKGVYDFSFCLYGLGGPNPTAANLRKNSQHLVAGYTHHSNGAVSTCNGVSVLLEVGDVVDIYLPANKRVLDNRNHHTTFRGHLLFQV